MDPSECTTSESLLPWAMAQLDAFMDASTEGHHGDAEKCLKEAAVVALVDIATSLRALVSIARRDG